MEVMRATEEWQRAGAYSVRIEGMNRQHHISLRDEFDENDTGSVILGRVVILPEYRGRGLGRMVVTEAEKWIAESGYKTVFIDSRLEVTEFYSKLGYISDKGPIEHCGSFDCVRMHKDL